MTPLHGLVRGEGEGTLHSWPPWISGSAVPPFVVCFAVPLLIFATLRSQSFLAVAGLPIDNAVNPDRSRSPHFALRSTTPSPLFVVPSFFAPLGTCQRCIMHIPIKMPGHTPHFSRGCWSLR